MRCITPLVLALALYAVPRGASAGDVRTTPGAESGVRIEIDTETDATLLQRAAKSGDISAVQRILARGAAVDLVDRDGWTPLMHSAANGWREAVTLLLQNGANTRARSARGDTPLQLAASQEDAP